MTIEELIIVVSLSFVCMVAVIGLMLISAHRATSNEEIKNKTT